MEYEKIKDKKTIEHMLSSRVRVKECGDILEVLKMSYWNRSCNIKKLNSNEYLKLDTGEIKEFIKSKDRSESKRALKRTFETIRDIVNTNVRQDNKHCVKWITFTYKENMTDTNQLYSDLKKMRMKAKYQFGDFEYISVVEPQGRGAWHSHEFWIFKEKAPFIANKWLRDKWGNGFVSIKKINNVDNQGAYLTAYLGDMPIEDAIKTDNIPEKCHIKEIDIEGETKRFIKGGRLHLYPNGFNIYRSSRGLEKKKLEYTNSSKIEKKVGSAKPTFETAFKLTFDDGKEMAVTKEYYNMVRSFLVD